jgi:anti-anti-sigma regulatory factor
LIGRDPGANEVSVVILDLTGTRIDDTFGAASLDQIVESIEAWGAEAVFAGLGPQSESVITGLSRPPIAVHREVQQAIVAGFQIAEAQRRTA